MEDSDERTRFARIEKSKGYLRSLLLPRNKIGPKPFETYFF